MFVFFGIPNSWLPIDITSTNALKPVVKTAISFSGIFFHFLIAYSNQFHLFIYSNHAYSSLVTSVVVRLSVSRSISPIGTRQLTYVCSDFTIFRKSVGGFYLQETWEARGDQSPLR